MYRVVGQSERLRIFRHVIDDNPEYAPAHEHYLLKLAARAAIKGYY